MAIVNLTPHAIVIACDDYGDKRTFPPSGEVARVDSKVQYLGDIEHGVVIHRIIFGDVVGLPPPVLGVWLIVSAMVRAACPSRTDLLSPGDLVRDTSGNVVGCKSLITESDILI